MPAGDEQHWLVQRRTWGVALQVLTVGFAVLLAILGGGKPPSTATNALIVIGVAAAQIGAAWAFSGEGKAHPALAERSVARLVGLASRARLAEARAQARFEETSRGQALHAEMGILSTEFSWISDGLVEAIEDWRTFHPKAVERAEARGNDQ
jgi:hypothetical protein